MLMWCFWQFSLPDHLDLHASLARAADPTESKVCWMACGWMLDVHGELRLWRWLEEFTTLRCIYPLALRWWGGAGRRPISRSLKVEGFGPKMYRKILAVLKHVESEASYGSTASFLAAAEHFAMQSEGAWLKVAGGAKAELLERQLSEAL